MVKSRGVVVPLPILLTAADSLIFRTGAESLPLANNHKTSPHLPKRRVKTSTGHLAMPPMVTIPRLRSFRSVARPTYNKSPAGSDQTIFLKLLSEITVIASGFL